MTLELVEPHQRRGCAYETCQQLWHQSPSTLSLSQVSAASAGLLSHTSHSLYWTSVPLFLLFVSMSSCVILSFYSHMHIMKMPHLLVLLGWTERVLGSVLAPLVLSNGAHQPFIKFSLVCLPTMVPMSLPLVHPQAVLSMFLIASVGLNIHKSHKEFPGVCLWFDVY